MNFVSEIGLKEINEEVKHSMEKCPFCSSQALDLTLMNQANVTINKVQKITKGLTNGEIDLSEGYIAKLQT